MCEIYTLHLSGTVIVFKHINFVAGNICAAGEELMHHPKELKGNNDVLNLTKPDLIFEIHKVFHCFCRNLLV